MLLENRRYLLHAKKVAWFGVMISLATLTLLSGPMSALAYGVVLGISTFHLMGLLPYGMIRLPFIAAPLLALFSPLALSFNIGFLGLFAYNIMGKNDSARALEKRHEMGSAEQSDLDIINKLERKTHIHVTNKIVCDVDESKFNPNAAAAGGFLNHTILVYSNILKPPFTSKEKKAIFAHEFGHLKHRDFLSRDATNFLFWTTCALAVMTFSLPLALLVSFTLSYASYAILQINELLADAYAAQQANPRALMSSLDKLTATREEKKKTNQPLTLSDLPKTIFHSFKHKMGMVTHPSCEVRKSYLAIWEEEKQTASRRGKMA